MWKKISLSIRFSSLNLAAPGDIIVGINGTFVLGRGVDAVLAELAAAALLPTIVLNLSSIEAYNNHL